MRDTSVDRAIQKALERASRQPQGQCPDHNQLAAYLESRCAAPERLRLEDHFASCGTCRQLLALSLRLSESETGEMSRRSLARRRLFRFAIPASVLVAAAVLLGIVVVWQKKSTLPANQTADSIQFPASRLPRFLLCRRRPQGLKSERNRSRGPPPRGPRVRPNLRPGRQNAPNHPQLWLQ